MSLQTLSREELTRRFYSLQEQVVVALQGDVDIDTFLDNTTIFDEWEEALPDQEFGVFLITVLNNIQRKSIVNVIVSAILREESRPWSEKPLQTSQQVEGVTGHPFC